MNSIKWTKTLYSPVWLREGVGELLLIPDLGRTQVKMIIASSYTYLNVVGGVADAILDDGAELDAVFFLEAADLKRDSYKQRPDAWRKETTVCLFTGTESQVR